VLLLDQASNSRVGVQVEGIHPRELVPDLQVEEVVVCKTAVRLPLLKQLGVPRIGIDHPPARRVKELGQHRRFVLVGQHRHRLQAEFQMPVPRALFREGLELHKERWD
jgi:hypothetical protein